MVIKMRFNVFAVLTLWIPFSFSNLQGGSPILPWKLLSYCKNGEGTRFSGRGEVQDSYLDPVSRTEPTDRTCSQG